MTEPPTFLPLFQGDAPARDPRSWLAVLRAEPSVSRYREFSRLRQGLIREGVLPGDVVDHDVSLLARALEMRAFWAIRLLLDMGFRPLPGEAFLKEIAEHFPGGWRRAWRVCAATHAATPGLLHCAAALAKPSLVRDILAAGADPQERDHRGQTPLHAVWRGPRAGCIEAETVASRLLAAGARMDVPDAAGWHPFHALLETFPARRRPPAINLETVAVDAPTPDGVAPLALLLRASAADFTRAASSPSGRNPISPLPWLVWLSPLAPDSGSLDAMFETWRDALVRVAGRPDVVAAVEPLWDEWRLRSCMPPLHRRTPRRRL